jgi:hypothetical protein
LAAEFTAWQVQRDFGRLQVSNIHYENENGITVRAKLLSPKRPRPKTRFQVWSLSTVT